MQTRNKVLLGVVVLIAASWAAMSGSGGADPYLDIHVLLDEADAREGMGVAAVGEVVANTTRVDGTTVHFLLRDQSGKPEHANRTIPVVYTGALPDAFGPKSAVASGVLRQGPEGLWLEADDIQVGCSSKY